MDIIGIKGQEAEAELLSALVTLFERLGLTSADVGIKINSRKVLQELLLKYEIQEEAFAAVCVIVDKLGKIPEEEVAKQLGDLGIGGEAIKGILEAIKATSIDELEALLGSESEAVSDLNNLLYLTDEDGYNIRDWLELDAGVVRGLAYYTGTVFEGFDRSGSLRAICGGGRYDKLLGTFGGDNQPCAGFGFGDAVIVELLKDKDLVPELNQEVRVVYRERSGCYQVDDFVFVIDEELRDKACMVATALRKSGRTVDLGLDSRRMKWAFKVRSLDSKADVSARTAY